MVFVDAFVYESLVDYFGLSSLLSGNLSDNNKAAKAKIVNK